MRTFRWSVLWTVTSLSGRPWTASSDPSAIVAPSLAPVQHFLTADKQEISCLILDLNIPGLSGFEVLHRLAKMNYLIPPTILFGDSDGELREEALRRGAVAVLQKACGNENLLAAVASALRLSTR